MIQMMKEYIITTVQPQLESIVTSGPIEAGKEQSEEHGTGKKVMPCSSFFAIAAIKPPNQNAT